MTALLSNQNVLMVFYILEDFTNQVFVDSANNLSNIGIKFNKKPERCLNYIVFD